MELDNPERGSDSRTLKNIIKTPGGQVKKIEGKVKYNRLPKRKKRNSILHVRINIYFRTQDIKK